MKYPSTCPPKTYIFDPRMFREWPYRPEGRGPAGTARDHWRVAMIVSDDSMFHMISAYKCLEDIVSRREHLNLPSSYLLHTR